MADDGNRVTFPEELEEIKAKIATEVNATETRKEAHDSNRVVFPDELEEIKAKIAETKATETNSLEEPPQ